MGISGLLPLLKSVQKPTHLSELAGKTIAVDAYVWLHRGAYSCASELVTGQPTTKYVDYAMHRVRLLQYHKIIPYVVFDGGPLPAKKGTEEERKRKRDENLALANTLARTGKHNLAREHYVKCVDITPQMAFQLIKALRAEDIPYVVAPYEADAQLFHLEATGLVNGILTEDSDLLIFGTQLLLLKLDPSTAMCTAITANTLASNSSADLPLHGWGVKELRECAMMSGCDYIEGVRGVGLKTASKYLRKWGTVEKALRALRMDGKGVEQDWEERMRKAEVGFMNQRVWDPQKEEIVYLTEPDWATWNDEREKFVGSHIEAGIAGGVARGDIDPITLQPMVDIMPSFQPKKHPSRSRPLALKDYNRYDVMDNSKTTLVKGSLLQYFSKYPKNSNPRGIASPKLLPLTSTMQVGRASGKRTLVGQYDHEISVKRQKLANENTSGQSSKFFAPAPASLSIPMVPFDDDKENLEELEDLDKVYDAEVEFHAMEEFDMVDQVEGYMSPPISSPGRIADGDSSKRHATPDFSSPLPSRTYPMFSPRRDVLPQFFDSRHSANRDMAVSVPQKAEYQAKGLPWGSDDGITSPPTAPRLKAPGGLKAEHTQAQLSGRMACMTQPAVTPPQDTFTVDLRDIFGSDTDLLVLSSPVTTLDDEALGYTMHDGIEDDEAEIAMLQRQKIVAAGWEKKFSSSLGREGRGSQVKSHEPVSVNVKGKAKTQFKPGLALRRCETIRQVSKLRRPESLSQIESASRTSVRLASGSTTPRIRSGPKTPIISPFNSPIDDLGTVQLQAYRFR